METKEQKGIFLSILLGTLATSLLGSALTGEGVIRAGEDFNTTLSFNEF